MDEIEWTDEQKMTHFVEEETTQRFLLNDINEEGRRLMIFATDANLKHLRDSSVWYVGIVENFSQ